MISKLDLSYMEMAHNWAKNSTCKRKQVGVIVTKDNNIISTGYNGTAPKTNNDCEDEDGNTMWHVIHAEMNALYKITKSANSSDGATMYSTLSPCKECSKSILMCGIKRVVFRTQHSDISGLEFLITNGVEVEQLLLDGTRFTGFSIILNKIKQDGKKDFRGGDESQDEPFSEQQVEGGA